MVTERTLFQVVRLGHFNNSSLSIRSQSLLCADEEKPLGSWPELDGLTSRRGRGPSILSLLLQLISKSLRSTCSELYIQKWISEQTRHGEDALPGKGMHVFRSSIQSSRRNKTNAHSFIPLRLYFWDYKKSYILILQEVKVVVLIIILPVHPFDGCTLILDDWLLILCSIVLYIYAHRIVTTAYA